MQRDMPCLPMPEKGIGFPVSGVQGSYELPGGECWELLDHLSSP